MPAGIHISSDFSFDLNGSIKISGFDTGILNEGYNFEVHGGSISTHNVGVGLEAQAGSEIYGQNWRLHGEVADIAVGSPAYIELIDSYANRLLNLTEGSFSTLNIEIGHLANLLINTSDPQRQNLLLGQLLDVVSKYGPKVAKWTGGNLAWVTAVELLERLGFDLPF